MTSGVQPATDFEFSGEQPIPQGLPKQIGPYILQGLLGRGGMASVLRARHAEDHSDVALKIMDLSRVRQDAADMQERFAREIGILKRLDHPGIVKVVNHGEHQLPRIRRRGSRCRGSGFHRRNSRPPTRDAPSARASRR